MSLIGLVHLTERLLNQSQDDGNESGPSGKSAKPVTPQAVSNFAADEFRPSGSNPASEAGLFQVRQQSVFSASATVLSVQDGAATAAPEAAQSGAAGASATNPATVASAPTNATPGAAASAGTTDTQQVLAELQSLNTTLAALRLSQDEIAAVDRVAQLIKDFSPAAFASLINQLQVLAQDNAQPAVNANSTSAAAAGQTGGFSIQELSIRFAGIDETAQRGGQTLEFSAFQLQVSEVNLTLNNAATGQTAQIQALQPDTSPATRTASLTNAATA